MTHASFLHAPTPLFWSTILLSGEPGAHRVTSQPPPGICHFSMGSWFLSVGNSIVCPFCLNKTERKKSQNCTEKYQRSIIPSLSLSWLLSTLPLPEGNYPSCVSFFFLTFFFLGCLHGMWKFLGRGWNLSCSWLTSPQP